MIDAVLFIGALVGMVAGAALVARSPTFWVGLALVVWARLKPFVLKRMPKDDEEAVRKAALRGENSTKLWLELKRKRQKQNRSST